MIQLHKVDSSIIEAVGLNDDGLLTIKFHSSPRLYAYANTGQQHLEAIMTASSAGRWFRNYIRNNPDHPVVTSVEQ
jgi:hypothetical protein